MDVSDLDVLIEVLRLLQIMGKRSKFLTQRLKPEDQTELVQNLTAIAQVSWKRKQIDKFRGISFSTSTDF